MKRLMTIYPQQVEPGDVIVGSQPGEGASAVSETFRPDFREGTRCIAVEGESIARYYRLDRKLTVARA